MGISCERVSEGSWESLLPTYRLSCRGEGWEEWESGSSEERTRPFGLWVAGGGLSAVQCLRKGQTHYS